MNVIEKYFPDLTVLQKEKLHVLESLYFDWNSKINLISRKDIDYLTERHILHSMSIAKVIRFKQGTTVLDVGTGGGLPGIPLAILFPETNFTLVDSIQKKIKVVNSIKDELDLKNVVTHSIRTEEIKSSFDFITGRAVSSIPVFYNLVKDKLKTESINEIPNGIFYLKGGDFLEELASIHRPYSVFELQKFFTEEYFETKKLAHIY